MKNQPHSLTRREAVQRMLVLAAAASYLDSRSFGAAAGPATIGRDPNLHKKIIPWERVLTDAEMKSVTALSDLIIPADDKSPAASAVGVPDFINEWVSAPYPIQSADRAEVQDGLRWIDQEAQTRFGKAFAGLSEEQQRKICDDICFEPKATPERKKAARFFSKMRYLTAGGFYTTPEGWKDLGYIGNTPMPVFPGPPPDVLKHLGLA